MAAVLLAAGAQAQDYPSRPLRVLVPSAAGGAGDIVSRIIAKQEFAGYWEYLLDNASFTVERAIKRTDVSESFARVGVVPGAGSTLTAQRYAWTDRDALAAGSYLYRLRQREYLLQISRAITAQLVSSVLVIGRPKSVPTCSGASAT